MDSRETHRAGEVPEHFLASAYALGAIVLGGAVWSAMVVLWDMWSLLAVPWLGWMIGWSCRHGGRRMDAFIRVTAWLAALVGTLLALLVATAFSVVQASPGEGLRPDMVAREYMRLFTVPLWLGSLGVLLTLVGVRRALSAPTPPRRAAADAQVAFPSRTRGGLPAEVGRGAVGGAPAAGSWSGPRDADDRAA